MTGLNGLKASKLEFDIALTEFISYIQKIKDAVYYTKQNVHVDNYGSKYIRISDGTSVYCFICAIITVTFAEFLCRKN